MGEQQIIRIKGMITDIVNSKKLNTDLGTFVSSRKDKYGAVKADVFSIYLLTKSNWPKEVLETETALIPTELDAYVRSFHDYYDNQNPGQTKLVEWLLEEGYVEVSATFSAKNTKILVLTVPQYAILMLLSQAPGMRLTLGEIKESTKIKKIVGALGPLVGKKLVSRENAASKEKIEDKELLTLNMEFQSKDRKINFIVRKSNKGKSTEGDKEKIDAERRVKIESKIVSIMKSKKRLRFQELAAEVRKLLEDFFQPPDSLLRVTIDDLIKREFLERDENEMNVYLYKA